MRSSILWIAWAKVVPAGIVSNLNGSFSSTRSGDVEFINLARLDISLAIEVGEYTIRLLTDRDPGVPFRLIECPATA